MSGASDSEESCMKLCFCTYCDISFYGIPYWTNCPSCGDNWDVEPFNSDE